MESRTPQSFIDEARARAYASGLWTGAIGGALATGLLVALILFL